MPELPEVETIRRGLVEYLPGRVLADVEVRLPKLVKNVEISAFSHILSGQHFTDVRRLGKILILDFQTHSVLDNNEFSISPLTGLQRAHGQFAPDKHTHIILHMQDNTSLCYRDIRQFGKWYLYKSEHLRDSPELNSLGPDPFSEEYTLASLAQNLKKTSRAVKIALLDQAVVAGLGNIYADEVLFASCIQPTRAAASLTDAEIEAVFVNIKQILLSAIANRGTTFSDYRDANGEKGENVGNLKVYGRGGEKCLTCGTELLKGRIASPGVGEDFFVLRAICLCYVFEKGQGVKL